MFLSVGDRNRGGTHTREKVQKSQACPWMNKLRTWIPRESARAARDQVSHNIVTNVLLLLVNMFLNSVFVFSMLFSSWLIFSWHVTPPAVSVRSHVNTQSSD